MEIKDFAKCLLEASTLAAKLTQPHALTDLHPQSATGLLLPHEPARPPNLRLPSRSKTRGKGSHRTRVPSPRDLESDTERGRLLHAFANHELLAMELMALALLRFSEAPTRFRMGLAATILEEQRHLGLYIQRMGELGVGFGEVPVSRFFWDAIASTTNPQAFMAQMALTLEQANLDFAIHYRNLFLEIGDAATAALLDTVHRDEIGHVAHGVAWMERWRQPEETLWQSYLRHLPPPLTPSRAKASIGNGIAFDLEARRAAGIPEDFIAELEVYAHSRGRPPVVFVMNTSCEDEIADGRAQDYNPSKAAIELCADLSLLLNFLAHEDDVVVVARRPSRSWKVSLRSAGFTVAQFLEDQGPDAAALAARLVERAQIWGASPRALAKARDLVPLARKPPSAPLNWRVFRKSWAASVHFSLSPTTAISRVVSNITEAAREITTITSSTDTHRPIIVKAPLGSAGRHMIRVLNGAMDERQQQWCKRILAEQGELVIEPHLHKVADISLQVEASATKPKIYGITRFLTDARGQYIGHRLGRRKFSDLSCADQRVISEEHLWRRFKDCGMKVAELLYASGYTGAAGIDALLHRQTDGTLALHPIVEINPRLTMGRIALALERRILGGIPAIWLHISLKRLKTLGFTDALAFMEHYAQQFPLQRRGTLMEAGVLATNDPATCTRILTVLAVGAAAGVLEAEIIGARVATSH